MADQSDSPTTRLPGNPDEAFLAELNATFSEVAGKDNQIDQAELQRALGIRDAHYAARIFAIVDEDGSGQVDRLEFLRFVENLIHGGEDDKLSFAFRLYDTDGNSSIEPAELGQIIAASLNEYGLEVGDDLRVKLADVMFRKVDTDGDGTISFDEFKAVLENYPDLKKRMTVSAATWLKPAALKPVTEGPSPAAKFVAVLRGWRRYSQNNLTTVLFVLLYAAVNIYLFANAVDTYAARGANIYVQIARGCGAALNFNGALILIPMLRIFLTWLRRTFVNRLVPIDESIEFHKLVAHVMFGLALLHTAAHLINYTTLPDPVSAYLFGTKAGLTGVLLLVVFVAMWVGALNFVRRQGHFELFYFTHLAFVLWFIFALLHGPVFWQWVLLPVVGYGIERIIRLSKTKNPVAVKSVTPLPSGVTRLELERPSGFHYRSGDYLFVRFPSISKREWHPFTITSCPEEEVLSVHVRGLGNWTRRLHDYAGEDHGGDRPFVYLDGPYGTPSTEVFASKVAVLIGAGIGVTPFASILKSMFLRKTEAGPEKVHFIWMNRDQYSFEWFANILAGLESDDTARRLEVAVYLTGVKLDMKSTGLDIAMDLYLKETGRDLLTGLTARTRLDRPDWKRVFAAIAEEHQGQQVDVYFCGPDGLARILGNFSAEHGFAFKKEHF